MTVIKNTGVELDPGTHRVRICANSVYQHIVESDETNNCKIVEFQILPNSSSRSSASSARSQASSAGGASSISNLHKLNPLPVLKFSPSSSSIALLALPSNLNLDILKKLGDMSQYDCDELSNKQESMQELVDQLHDAIDTAKTKLAKTKNTALRNNLKKLLGTENNLLDKAQEKLDAITSQQDESCSSDEQSSDDESQQEEDSSWEE